MLHSVAERRENEHPDRDGEEGELCVTVESLADQSCIKFEMSTSAGISYRGIVPMNQSFHYVVQMSE